MITDETFTGLPDGTFQACFWVKMLDSTRAGRACFDLVQPVDKLWVRLLMRGVQLRRIPWRKSASDIYAEVAPEVCDAEFEDLQGAEWCPWSSTFMSVFDQHGEKVDHLFD